LRHGANLSDRAGIGKTRAESRLSLAFRSRIFIVLPPADWLVQSSGSGINAGLAGTITKKPFRRNGSCVGSQQAPPES
jgi:hypothetical protein